jgi:HD-GYP domain-containing protein (c-di-GMP phosphodiesterase class II)
LRTRVPRLLDSKAFPPPSAAAPLDFPVSLFSLACEGALSGSRQNAETGQNQILIVGGESATRSWLARLLEEEGHPMVALAGDAASALFLLEQQGWAVLVLNLSPYESVAQAYRSNGIGLVAKAKAQDPTLQVITIVDQSGLELGLEAMRAGAFECLTTAETQRQIVPCIGRALERRRQMLNERAYYELIERAVYQRTRDLNTLVYELEEAYRQTLWALGSALESRDVETNAHSFRVMKYSQALAAAMGIHGNALKDIEYGVFLHDIGKIGVADAILFKPDKLTEEEWQVMREHPARGRYLLAGIKFLEGGLDIVYSHHERWDGNGYPQGLRAGDIPTGARIFAVGDTLDAMTSDRPYRRALSYEAARNEIITNSGIQFDPAVVEVFRQFGDADWNELREEAEELAQSIVRRKQDCLRI